MSTVDWAALSALADAGLNADDVRRLTIRQVYRDVLGRDPERGAYDYWVPLLRQAGDSQAWLYQTVRSVASAPGGEGLGNARTANPPSRTQPLPRRTQQGAADDAVAVNEDEGALAVLRDVLARYGLENLTDWAWGQIQDNRSTEEVLLDLREQPAFKERFKAIDYRRENGLTPVSPEDVVNYENQARDLMRASGLPAGFYDQPDDFAQLIGKGVSLPMINQRIEQVWNRVVDAPPEVRDAFAQYYGAAGDQALATFFFDPDKAESHLERMARAAVAGGAIKAFDLNADRSVAERVADLNLNDQTVRRGFAELNRIANVFRETIGERRDLTVGTEGVNTVFDTGPGAEDIRRRVAARRNEFTGSGGSYLDQQGLAGTAQ